ncbi:MAG: hypothetical protein ABI949_01825 [Ilumatobacteraceae bacterium]
MAKTDDENAPELPSILQRLDTDEYDAPPYDTTQQQAVVSVAESGENDARAIRRNLGDYWSSRLGTAAGLRALNEAFGAEYYDVPNNVYNKFLNTEPRSRFARRHIFHTFVRRQVKKSTPA